ncbi:metallophosphoesterase [Dysgonomonas sp. Marseille-P4361]|uniref:metallophosphoesterase family protein n=1 Tax=Dysgonomonas sp. Marseille-P4361 TaxID=2161820 RepID=UPI000D55A95E|nr:metallophosphoesterase [Dysgonomonas sp. Marseille-P4361]
MKRSILILLVLIISVCVSSQIKMGVISDTHYLSEKLMEDGSAIDQYIAASGKSIKATPEVLDKVLADYLESDIEMLFVCGDMTKDGERQSHLDFVEKLKPLQEKGVRVFVIPGNHDINMPNAVGYKEGEIYKVDNVSVDDFEEIYADCGYANALKKDDHSLSYLAQLDDKIWLLAIDAARYAEYENMSISSGRILPQTEEWIMNILNEAQGKDIQVIGMMHWGLTEHIVYQSEFFEQYLVDDWQRLAKTFADKGMKAIFTGHFHSNDISAAVSDNDNKIYDIETGTLSSYPYAYRYVDLYKDKLIVRTKNITEIPSNTNLAEEDRLRMKIVAEKQAAQKLKNFGLDLSPDVLPKFVEALSQLFVLHLYGDEEPNDALLKSIKGLSESMDAPFDVDDLELDFWPADNNVEIMF